MISRPIHDVVVVGAGPAGITAAIALARAGADVVVCEGGVYPGAENWSGAVYFTENLTALLGREQVEALPFERRVIRRGIAATDGLSSFELSYQERPGKGAPVFEDCYTVLRPVYDRALAEIASASGATILCSTTVEGLLRNGERIVGVQTSRGPLRSRAVFLAEGDASHLVQKEGFEIRGERPAFLHGVKEVLKLPAGAINERFGLVGTAGACLEILLRNGVHEGRTVQLNAGGFLYTNADSISLGIVLPVENLRRFRGEYNTLIEWYKQLPLVARLIAGADSTSFGAKVIRGGGIRQVPRQVASGLAIGGAAAGLGVDFPYPNYTGPATASGLLFARAYLSLVADGEDLTEANLHSRYVQPLRQTRYWHDMAHLRQWPHYVETTRAFFGAQVDLAAQSLHVLSEPGKGLVAKAWLLPRVVLDCLPRRRRIATTMDSLRGLATLGVIGTWVRAAPILLMLWLVNLLRMFVPRRRGAGSSLELTVRGADGEERKMPPLLAFAGRRLRPGLARAMAEAYRNDDRPLPQKLRRAIYHLGGSLNLLEVVLIAVAKLGFAVLLGVRALADLAWLVWKRPSPQEYLAQPSQRYRTAARNAGDLGKVTPALDHDAKLGEISYRGEERSHIRVFFPQALARGDAARDPAESSLWSICPAKVYQCDRDSSLSTSVAVLYENCVKCETCLHAEPGQVDWSRFRRQRLVYEVYPEAAAASEHSAAGESAGREQANTALAAPHPRLAATLRASATPGAPPAEPGSDEVDAGLREIERAAGVTRRQAHALSLALDSTPPVLERFHRDWLQRVASQISAAARELVGRLTGGPPAPWVRSALGADAGAVLAALAEIPQRLHAHADELRFFHAEADARQLLDWPLARLEEATRSLRSTLGGASGDQPPAPSPRDRLAGEAGWVRDALADTFDRSRIKATDDGEPLAPRERSLLARLLAEVPPESGDAGLRATLLTELGRVDPSLGVLCAFHLAARDACMGCHDSLAARLARGDRLASFALLPPADAGARVEVPYVLGAFTDQLILVDADGRVFAAAIDGKAVRFQATGGIGLRAGRPGRLTVETSQLSAPAGGKDAARRARLLRCLWRDQLALALGATEYLTERALEHATSRVQFPNLFRDRRGRDGIVKFGAVRSMLAGLAANRALLDTLVFGGDAPDDDVLAALHRVAGLEAHGTRPTGSAYLAGQVFGGMAYSEDDLLAKHYRDAAALQQLAGTQEELARLAGGEFLASLRDGAGLTSDEEAGKLAAAVRAAQLDPDPWSADGAAAAAEVGFALASEAGAHAVRERSSRAIADADPEAEILDAAADVLAERAADVVAMLPATLSAIPVRVWLGSEILAAGTPDFDRRPASEVSFDYGRDLLQDGAHYSSGDFLRHELGGGNRFVPDAVWGDPGLLALRRELAATFVERFRGTAPGQRKRFGPKQLEYQRYLDEIHQVPREDIEWMSRRGYYRMYIPPALGGGGHTKAEYYELCNAAMRYPDPAVALTIQASSSIGTTPILIGLQSDLASGQAELEGLLQHPEQVAEILDGLDALLALLGGPGALRAEPAYLALRDKIGATLRRPRMVRALLRPVIAAYDAAGLAGRQRDLDGFVAGLEAARAALAGWREELTRALAEFPARRAAHEFYLRLIASGRVSAFALTEPSAGSDTARIRTRAARRSVELRRDPRGFHTFVPEGAPDDDGSGRRVLLDMARFEFDFDQQRTFYRLGFDDEQGQLVEVLQNDYVYGPDESKFRVLVIGGERIPAHDLGSPRRVELKGGTVREVYDYFQVDGSKMWITNGHIAGVVSLFARTERGPTGLMLDGHAEGLTVGKDEEKMGQRGGPTNELTMQAVRIPVTCIIGIEGRGQENALETLNVGRAGLLVSCLGVLRDLVCDAITDLRGGPARGRTDVRIARSSVSPAAPYWFGRALEEMLACDALASNLIGLADHPGTASARMESAIGKYFGGESMHRILDWVEHAYGASSPSAEHDLEKKRRDARIINIYEGTNEVQRFLITKDLVGLARKLPERPAPSADDEATSALARARQELLDQLQRAVSREGWGDRVWQEVRYQPLFFQLADMAGWIAVADSLVNHERWVRARLGSPDDEPYRERMRRATLSFVRQGACVQVEHLARRFAAGLERLGSGGHEPAVLRLADLVIDGAERAAAVAPPAPVHASVQVEPGALVAITVLVEPAPRLAPRPRVAGGKIVEPVWDLSSGSSLALEAARQMVGQAAPGTVRIQAVAVGDAVCVPVLRRALACGADLASWIDCGGFTLDRGEIAAALATLVRDEEDAGRRILLAGRQTGQAPEPPEGELGLRVAALLGGTYLGDCSEVRLLDGPRVAAVGAGTGGVWVEAELPASVMLASAHAQSHAHARELEALSAERHVWAERVGIDRIVLRSEFGGCDQSFELPAGGARPEGADVPAATSPEAAARLVLAAAELDEHDDDAEAAPPFAGKIETMPAPWLGKPSVVVVAPPGELDSLAGPAARLAEFLQLPWRAVAWMPGADDAELRAVAGSPELAGCSGLVVIDSPQLVNASLVGRSEALHRALRVHEGVEPVVLCAASLADAAQLAGGEPSWNGVGWPATDPLTQIVVEELPDAAGGDEPLRVTLVRSAAGGRLRARRAFRCDRDLAGFFFCAADTLQLELPPAARGQRQARTGAPLTLVVRLELPDLAYDAATDAIARAIASAAEHLGLATLTDAEFIVDIGYGVGSADGLEAVLEPVRRALAAAGVPGVMVGATRKVTQDLGILPDDHQIGQTGVSVNPKVLLAIGVSGAPQHLAYIGEDAVIFAFNKDPQAPLMTLGERQARPRVYPVPGDLFRTIPAFLEALTNPNERT